MAWRATIAAAPERWGDAILVRKDVPTSYHLAVVVDDAWQGVTHVTRGRDLFAATDLHRLLQVLLDLPAPHYHHHRLLADASGRKLAKSEAATSLASCGARASPRPTCGTVGLAPGNHEVTQQNRFAVAAWNKAARGLSLDAIFRNRISIPNMLARGVATFRAHGRALILC
jgi:glutamyl/glutaminyl-tRNA synthetase